MDKRYNDSKTIASMLHFDLPSWTANSKRQTAPFIGEATHNTKGMNVF